MNEDVIQRMDEALQALDERQTPEVTEVFWAWQAVKRSLGRDDAVLLRFI